MTIDRQRLDEMLVDYLYDELEPDDLRAFEAALADHPEVQADVAAHRQTRAWLQEVPEQPVRQPVLDNILREARLVAYAEPAPSLWDRIAAWVMRPSVATAMVFLVVAGTAVYISQDELPETRSERLQYEGSPVGTATPATSAVEEAPGAAEQVAKQQAPAPKPAEMVPTAPATAPTKPEPAVAPATPPQPPPITSPAPVPDQAKVAPSVKRKARVATKTKKKRKKKGKASAYRPEPLLAKLAPAKKKAKRAAPPAFALRDGDTKRADHDLGVKDSSGLSVERGTRRAKEAQAPLARTRIQAVEAEALGGAEPVYRSSNASKTGAPTAAPPPPPAPETAVAEKRETVNAPAADDEAALTGPVHAGKRLFERYEKYLATNRFAEARRALDELEKMPHWKGRVKKERERLSKRMAEVDALVADEVEEVDGHRQQVEKKLRRETTKPAYKRKVAKPKLKDKAPPAKAATPKKPAPQKAADKAGTEKKADTAKKPADTKAKGAPKADPAKKKAAQTKEPAKKKAAEKAAAKKPAEPAKDASTDKAAPPAKK